MARLLFRSASARDVPAVRALLCDLAAHEGGHPTASEAALLAHGFGPRPLWQAIIAEDGEAALGLVVYYPDFSTVRGEAGLYVQDLFVADAARGRGIGRGLLAAAQRAAERDWDARYLVLGVSPDNEPARAAYERMGFRARGYDFLLLEGAGWERLAADAAAAERGAR